MKFLGFLSVGIGGFIVAVSWVGTIQIPYWGFWAGVIVCLGIFLVLFAGDDDRPG